MKTKQISRWSRSMPGFAAAVALLITTSVYASPGKLSKTHLQPTNSIALSAKKAQVQVAQTKAVSRNDNSIAKKKKAPPALPKGAIVLEGVSAAVVGVGVFLIGFGATNIGIRNNLDCVGVDESASVLTGGCKKGDPEEIKSLEESGNALLTAGWITLGVGLTGLVAGGIWMLAHQPGPPLLLNDQPLPPPSPSSAQVLWKAGP
ncbi:MAG: hypothetical protein EP343_03285 [Deltaproteobacteria bacterium]|nr:MAG: hypothetical protein EP343_03285 [Deltaproteobacteria bacterium]